MSRRIFALSAVVLLVLAACAAGEKELADETAWRADFAEARASERALNSGPFVEAGFRPLAELTAGRREVRRALLRPWGTHGLIGVEVERLRGGIITVSVIGEGVSDNRARLTPTNWVGLLAREKEVFRETRYNADAYRTHSLPAQALCEGTMSSIESTGAKGERVVAAIPCGPGIQRHDYAVELARLAVATRPGCAFDRASPAESLTVCFAGAAR